MKQDEIIEMATLAGFLSHPDADYIVSPYESDDQDLYKELESFAKLVAEREREECAKICETRFGPTVTDFYGNVYAKEIRARQ